MIQNNRNNNRIHKNKKKYIKLNQNYKLLIVKRIKGYFNRNKRKLYNNLEFKIGRVILLNKSKKY